MAERRRMEIRPEHDPEVAAIVGKLKMPSEDDKQTNNQANKFVELITFSVKLSRGTVNALRKASVERKIANTFPASQQDIVQTALDTWLKDEGYLS
jgi:hypothetical protein